MILIQEVLLLSPNLIYICMESCHLRLESYHVAQASLELTIHLPQSSKSVCATVPCIIMLMLDSEFHEIRNLSSCMALESILMPRML